MMMALMVVTSGLLSAQRGRSMSYGMKKGAGFGQAEMTGPGYGWNRLNLTSEQEEKVGELRKEHLKKVLPLRDKLAELQVQYRNLLHADSPDRNAINKNIDEQSDVRKKLQKEAADFQLQFRALLDEDQKLMLDAAGGRKGSHFFHGQRGFSGKSGRKMPGCFMVR